MQTAVERSSFNRRMVIYSCNSDLLFKCLWLFCCSIYRQFYGKLRFYLLLGFWQNRKLRNLQLRSISDPPFYGKMIPLHAFEISCFANFIKDVSSYGFPHIYTYECLSVSQLFTNVALVLCMQGYCWNLMILAIVQPLLTISVSHLLLSP